MPDSVALLRAINVGGRNKVPMAELRSLFDGMGLGPSRTYIQSGNVFFPCAGDPDDHATGIADAIRDRFGLEVPVVTRTVEALRAARDADPFPQAERSERHVAFLDRLPSPEAVAQLDPDRSPGDHFAVVGREIHLWLASGMGNTKLGMDWFERRLGVKATARNWRTLEVLCAG